jgi:hypothetical protein
MAELLDQQSYCGFCNSRVGASLADREAHMFSCRKHPAFAVYNALDQVYLILNDTESSAREKVAQAQIIAARGLDR